RISGNLRVGKDWVARLGGEEFAVVLPATSAKDAAVDTGRLRERIASARFEVMSQPIGITASFVVCALECCGSMSLQALAARMVGEAGTALYQSKHMVRRRVT